MKHPDMPADVPQRLGGHIRLKIELAYDGTDFHGWAVQPALRTVQGILQQALSVLCQQTVTVTVAGRTDAGVHASGQVIHCDIPVALWESLHEEAGRALREEVFLRRLGKLVRRFGGSDDVVIHSVQQVPATFDARFSAISRQYRYRIADDRAQFDPLRRHDTYWLGQDLSVETMNRAADTVLGFHDFLTFCRPRPGATTLRTLQEFSWERVSSGIVVAQIRSDAFCHNMVRALVSACVQVGLGEYPSDWLQVMLDRKERTSMIGLAPPHGLVLEQVVYPAADGFAAQAERTRAMRLDEFPETDVVR